MVNPKASPGSVSVPATTLSLSKETRGQLAKTDASKF